MKQTIAVVALALLVAACSGGPSSTGSDSSAAAAGAGAANPTLLAFAQCMRARGVPDFPDPQAGDSGAKFPSAQQLGVSASRYQAAENLCQHLLPAGSGDQFPPAEVPLLLSGMRLFSQCMRSHGVPDWPDPITDAEGRPVFDPGADGITQAETRSPQFQAKITACQHLLPNALGGLPIGGP
jgi:hypothetical protein